MQRDDFFRYYYTVFTPNGFIRPCGRKACITLMQACIGRAHVEGILESANFGDLDYGFMNVENVKALAIRLYPEISFREAYLAVFDESHNRISDDAEAMETLVQLAMQTVHFYKMSVHDFEPRSLQKLYVYFFPKS